MNKYNVYIVQIYDTSKSFPLIAKTLSDVVILYPEAYKIECRHKDVEVAESEIDHDKTTKRNM